ncbi:hypothetical protein BCS84_18155 [Vibrio cyclitrophicus]|uniref:hypothetical protein n=1 Tax=Vibrio cyclitrophicus TaxID=47951 RepID=UPI0002FA3957|nr:hypothetical protein [Vibrio cyclitrophicus]OEE17943.1 hypothetical protein OC1_08010 [Vibrio cyclitrophicus ZF207]PME26817.1 hypothetical protein BCV41_14150 [Vibrio cyclitrophicus]PMP53286.1 hypothetical protein BCS84_01285 [Vibrio cyclitrophicus]
MSFNKEIYLLLLQESKKALAPFKVTRSVLATMLNRQRITDELIYELAKIAQEEGVIFAQTENDFILVAKFYDCDYSRIYREEFSREELNDIEENAQLKSQRLLQEIDLESSFDENGTLIDKLDVIFDAINELVTKAEDAPMEQKLADVEQHLTLSARYIRDEYIKFTNSDELGSDDLDLALDEFHHSGSFDNMLEEALVISANPHCYNSCPQDAFYLAILPISQCLTQTLDQITEEYNLIRDVRKGVYSDKR